MFSDAMRAAAREVLDGARAKGLKVALAESCTGGLVAALLTEIPGSSDVVDRGFVTYSYASKVELLGVPQASLDARGAVSEEVARAMAEGAIARSGADVAVSITGIAGPGGGTPDKPVGLVHFAVVRRGGPTRHAKRVFAGDRPAVRLAAVDVALALLRDEIAAR